MNNDRPGLEGLTQLGKTVTEPSRALETFPNARPGRWYRIRLTTEEFTCRCPVTGQPDFATISVEYVPDAKVIESKSLKLYFWSYRDQGIFHEDAVNQVLDDLNAALEPHAIRVTGAFRARGGIALEVKAQLIRTPEAEKALY